MRTDKEVEQRHSRATVPGQTSIISNPRIIEQLKEKRKYHGDIAFEELKKDPPNYEIVNPNQFLATLYHDAVTALEKLMEQNALLTETLKNRVLVALSEAKAPAWVPTHRHYKGTLYRVTGIRYDAEHEELVEKVEYDDEHGGRFVLAKRRWESVLDSGKQRYEFLYPGSADPVRAIGEATFPARVSMADIEKKAKEKIKATGMGRAAAFDAASVDYGFTNYADAAAKLGKDITSTAFLPVKDRP